MRIFSHLKPPALCAILACFVLTFIHIAQAMPQEVSAVKAKLDVPPSTTQKPYSPADGQRVPVNPPPFIWVPAVKDATYALQVSPSEDFAEPETLTFRDIGTSVFVPREPLEPGGWFWRYGVETSEGVVWGRGRPFTVPEDAREFPFPDFEASMARIPKERPRLFFPGERLQQIRAYARGELESQVASLLRRCEEVIGEEIVPEPPRPQSGPERVHVMRTTRPPMDYMERCALAYLLTGDEKFGLEAKRRLIHFFSWDPNGPTSLWSYDEPAMWVMMRGTRAYDWTYELFTPEEREKIEPVMKIRAEHFYKYLEKLPFESNPYNSHAGRMPGFLGEAAICFAHEWPGDARRWIEYATLLYYTSYPAWGGDEGGWQEGPGYWGAYMNFALHYVIALHHATGVDLMGKPFFRNTGYYALYTATPYHEHAPYGDGQTGSPRGLGGVMYAFSTLAQNPYFRWYQRESGRSVGGDLLTLSTYDPDLPAANPKDLPHGRLFNANGLAALHTALGDKDNDITFLMRSSPYGGVSHGHSDQNAFVIEAFGKGLAIATGYYPWYGSPHHHDWTRATRAKNNILVNGEGQVRRSWDARGEITAFELAEGYDYVEGEAAEAYGGRLERFRRHVVHVRPGIFVMFDDLVAGDPSTFQWLLHAHDRIGIDGPVLHVRRDPAAMDVHLLLPQQLDISQTDQYDPPPETVPEKHIQYRNTWHLTAATATAATTTQFLSTFVVYRAQGEAKPPEVRLLEGSGAVGVRLARNDGAYDVVAFRTDPEAGEVSCGELTSAARVFAGGYDKSGDVVRKLEIPNTSD
jgi:hypothetical protein